MRKGVPVKHVIEAIKYRESTVVKIDKNENKSIVYKTKKCMVSVNLDIGELIQTTLKE